MYINEVKVKETESNELRFSLNSLKFLA